MPSSPRAILSILNCVDGDLLAVDDDVILASLNGVLVLADLAQERALCGVVLQQVSQHSGAGQIVDGDDFVTVSLEHLTESQTPIRPKPLIATLTAIVKSSQDLSFSPYERSPARRYGIIVPHFSQFCKGVCYSFNTIFQKIHRNFEIPSISSAKPFPAGQTNPQNLHRR